MQLDKAIREAIREAENCQHPQWVYVSDRGTYYITDNPAVYHDERIICRCDRDGRVSNYNPFRGADT